MIRRSPLAQAIADVASPSGAAVALHEPRFAGREWDYVKECLDTGWVSSVGKYVDLFEVKLAEACGAAHAVAVVNGTAALEVAFHLVGVKAGDEVLIPTLTFVATANAVCHLGAVPHLVDSDAATLGIDPGKLGRHLAEIVVKGADGPVNKATGRRLAAVAPMHTFGHPVDMDALSEVAARFDLPVVEDATESLGTLYKGKPTGALSRVGTMSFNGNKIVTTGGGGAILTDDPDLAKRAKHLTTTAKLRHRWAFIHDEIGWNYRLPNINSALGCAQLEQLPVFLAEKRALAEAYLERFEGMNSGRIMREPEGARSNYWLNALILDDPSVRDDLLTETNDLGLMTRPCWTLMHHLPIYAESPRGDLSAAEDIERRLVNLPSSASLGSRFAGHA